MRVLLPFANHKDLILPETREILQNAGFEIVCNDTGKPYEVDRLKALLREMDAVYAGGEPYTADVLEQAERLKILARFGVGLENIDLDACRRRNIAVVRGENNNAVAEHAVMLMLSVLRETVVFDRHVRNGRWPRANFHEIAGKTVGIVGFGQIGRRVAEILSGFHVRILAFDPYIKQDDSNRFNASFVSLEELLSRSDIVTLHIPGTSENRHLIDAQQIASMKDGAVLINTARGSVVSQEALAKAIESGKLYGAGLDVFEQEPVKEDNPLLALDHVTLSPHVASGTYEAHLNMGNSLAQAIIEACSGREPHGRIV